MTNCLCPKGKNQICFHGVHRENFANIDITHSVQGNNFFRVQYFYFSLFPNSLIMVVSLFNNMKSVEIYEICLHMYSILGEFYGIGKEMCTKSVVYAILEVLKLEIFFCIFVCDRILQKCLVLKLKLPKWPLLLQNSVYLLITINPSKQWILKCGLVSWTFNYKMNCIVEWIFDYKANKAKSISSQ